MVGKWGTSMRVEQNFMNLQLFKVVQDSRCTEKMQDEMINHHWILHIILHYIVMRTTNVGGLPS